jgi:hypothetical protein
MSAAHTDEEVEGVIAAFSWLTERYGESVLHL